MRIVVPERFVSKKTAISWAEAGMRQDKDAAWLSALNAAVIPHSADLRGMFENGSRLRLRATIYGDPQMIKPLDIHDALAQIVNQLTDILFPREKGKPKPQTQDRHFWKVEGEKVVDELPRVVLEIDSLE
jgi:hypothetical protein